MKPVRSVRTLSKKIKTYDKKVEIIRSDNGTGSLRTKLWMIFAEKKGLSSPNKPHNKTPYELFRDYVPFTTGTSLMNSAVHQKKTVRDCIVMPFWTDTYIFDSLTKDVENGEPKTIDDPQKQVEDGPSSENAEQERFSDYSSTKNVNAAGQHVNTASPDVTTGSLKLNVVGPSVNTASTNEQDSTEEEPKVDLGNIINSYIVPTTPNTRIQKDHPIDNCKSLLQLTVDLEKNLLVKDGDVDVHLYRSMIGSLMYLTASRPDIMFAVCACARFQVTPKTSHLLAVKKIFRYLKGKPTLGLWYSWDSPFELIAYTDSDYAGATQDKKSTTGGCQFLGNKLISWQCKKQTVVATSTTEAEYVAAVAAASCCGTSNLGFQNQLMIMDTKIPQSSGPPVKIGDEAVHKELGDRMERAATTASSLEAE
ncbi:hypothetical protein Tco_0894705 [Tanacetum coccineum]|uniref:Reverse transcriptase Ty1/copia-type domain-containing protein n=1 Tax=Tanacetum coccineum TaxID=301880 RepID=A0ABQ5CF54_9ASTR